MKKIYQLMLVTVCTAFFSRAEAQNGLSFDGTNDVVTTTQPGITGSSARTIEAWIKVPTTTSTSQHVIVDMGTISTNTMRFTLNIINGQNLRIEYGGNGFTYTGTDITTGTWKHVAVTYNNSNASGQKCKLFIDGAMVMQQDFTGTPNTAASNIYIGQRVDGVNFFEGVMDEVRVWNIERTAAQILADYNHELCSVPAGLIAYYKMNEGTAGGSNTGVTTIANTATPANTGTLVNFALTGSSSNFVAGAPITLGGSTSSTINASACSSYTSPANHVYTTSGTYHDTIPNTAGCDSIITINLTIGSAPVTAITASPVGTTTATLKWNPVSGVSGYQYVLDQTAAAPSGAGTGITDTFYSATLLSPSTTYYMHVRTSCGSGFSTWTTQSFVTLCQAPAITGYADSFHCGTGAVTLAATTVSGASIKWYAAATGGSALATGNTYTTPVLSTNTNYYITAITGTCESSPRQMVTAQIRAIPVVNLGNDTTICPGISYTFNAGNPGGTYLWSTGETTQTVTKNAAGSYNVKVTVNGCSNRDTILITPGITPVNVMADTVNVCMGDTVTLNAGNAGSTYLWSPGGATTQTISVSTEGNYSVNIRSIHGCVITSNTYSKIRPLPVDNLGADTAICESNTITLNAGNPGYAYNWSTGANTQTINVTDSGTYSVTVTTPYNCTNSEDIHVAFLPSPRVEGFNFVPKFFEQIGRIDFSPLNPTDVNSFVWDFGDGSPVVTQMNPVHIYGASGLYTVTLTVINGCTDYTVSQTINVGLPPTGLNNINPNGLSMNVYPNPANDVLRIDNGKADYRLEELWIYNAVGALVYHSSVGSVDSTQVHVGELSNGIYMLKVLTDKGYVNRQFQVIK